MRLIPIAIAAAAATALAGCESSKAGFDLREAQTRESYSVGNLVGQQLKQSVGSEEDTDAFLAGLADAYAGEARLTPDQVMLALEARQERERIEAAERAEVLAEKNAAEGTAFLDAFSSDPDAVMLPSGLGYKVLAEGEGAVPGPDDVVSVHYRGRYLDGTEFDSSYDRTPAQLRVGGVIPGWSEALQQMPVGSRWELVVPPVLAYGAEGAGDVIEPNQTLVFELELLEIEQPVG